MPDYGEDDIAAEFLELDPDALEGIPLVVPPRGGDGEGEADNG